GSPSEQVLATTAILVSLLALESAFAERSRVRYWELAASLAFLACAVLTRVDMFPRGLLAAAWVVVLRPEREQRQKILGSLARVWLPAYAVLGGIAYFGIVVPSNHPAPGGVGMLVAGFHWVLQYPVLALRWPHWISLVALVFGAVGLRHLWRSDRRLLGAILGYVAFAFIISGQDMLRDDLLSARYFLDTLAIGMIVPGYGAWVLARALCGRLGPRVLASRWWTGCLSAVGSFALAA